MATLKYFTTYFTVAACAPSVYQQWRTQQLPAQIAAGQNVNAKDGIACPSNLHHDTDRAEQQGRRLGDVDEEGDASVLTDAIWRGDVDTVEDLLVMHHLAGDNLEKQNRRFSSSHLDQALKDAYDYMPGIYIDDTSVSCAWRRGDNDLGSVNREITITKEDYDEGFTWKEIEDHKAKNRSLYMTTDATSAPCRKWAKWRIDKWWSTDQGKRDAFKALDILPCPETTKRKTPITVALKYGKKNPTGNVWAMMAFMKDSKSYTWTEKNNRTAKVFFDKYNKDDSEMYILQHASFDLNLFHPGWSFLDSVFHDQEKISSKFLDAIEGKPWKELLEETLREGSIAKYHEFDMIDEMRDFEWRDVLSDPEFAFYVMERTRRIVSMIKAVQKGEPPVDDVPQKDFVDCYIEASRDAESLRQFAATAAKRQVWREFVNIAAQREPPPSSPVQVAPSPATVSDNLDLAGLALLIAVIPTSVGNAMIPTPPGLTTAWATAPAGPPPAYHPNQKGGINLGTNSAGNAFQHHGQGSARCPTEGGQTDSERRQHGSAQSHDAVFPNSAIRVKHAGSWHSSGGQVTPVGNSPATQEGLTRNPRKRRRRGHDTPLGDTPATQEDLTRNPPKRRRRVRKKAIGDAIGLC